MRACAAAAALARSTRAQRCAVVVAAAAPLAVGVFLGDPRLERTAMLERGPAVKGGLRADEQAATVQRDGYARRLIGGEARREQSRRRRVQHRRRKAATQDAIAAGGQADGRIAREQDVVARRERQEETADLAVAEESAPDRRLKAGFDLLLRGGRQHRRQFLGSVPLDALHREARNDRANVVGEQHQELAVCRRVGEGRQAWLQLRVHLTQQVVDALQAVGRVVELGVGEFLGVSDAVVQQSGVIRAQHRLRLLPLPCRVSLAMTKALRDAVHCPHAPSDRPQD